MRSELEWHGHTTLELHKELHKQIARAANGSAGGRAECSHDRITCMLTAEMNFCFACG
jgi:hypothetical protein